MSLPWDPLAASYRKMALAQRKLAQPWCAGDEEEGRRWWKEESGSTTLWREEFSADDSVKALGGFLLVSVFFLGRRNDKATCVFTFLFFVFCFRG